MQRRFGVEIELTGLTASRAATILQAAGLDASYGSRGSSGQSWLTTHDGSIRGEGCEVVSPILFGDEGLRAVAKAAEALERAGADINRSCGLHVHIDAGALSGMDIAKIVLRYARFERRIDEFMPESRRGNNNNYTKTITDIRGVRSVEKHALVREFSDRYRKVNVCAMSRHGTLEFRHHSGTVNAVKIVNWIKFLQQFVEASCNLSVAPIASTPVATPTPAPTATPAPQRQPRSRSERVIVAALRQHAQTLEQLSALTGMTPDSVRCSISSLRGQGFRVDYRRYIRCYCLLEAGVAVAPIPTVRVATGFALTIEAITNVADDLWNGIEAGVVDFYRVRASALANA